MDKIKEIRLCSTYTGLGIPLAEDEETEQRINITNKGKVSFRAFHIKNETRKCNITISKMTACSLLKWIFWIFNENEMAIHSVGCGKWKLTVIDNTEKKYYFEGLLSDDLYIPNKKRGISEYFRLKIPIDDLFLFDAKEHYSWK